jgi:hypothetical protein
MNFRYCPNCAKKTAHKRALGIGTLIAVFLTLGLWVLLIPFYPTRCLQCGSSGTINWNGLIQDFRQSHRNDKILLGAAAGILILLAILIAAAPR